MTVKIALLIQWYTVLVKLAKAQLTGFIVGGEESRIKDFPHSAFIKMSLDESVCGASILNQVILLTAAHCVLICPDGPCVTAYAGSERRFHGSVSNVSSIKIHERYNMFIQTNDIALLRLQANLRLGKLVKKVIIMKNPPKYRHAKVAGWGRVINDAGSTGSLVLKHTRQLVLDRETCEDIVSILPLGTICGQDHSFPYKGDSGSALVVKKRRIQIGIVSFKRPMLSDDTTVYTDVSFFYDWIVDNARKLYCAKKWGKESKEAS